MGVTVGLTVGCVRLICFWPLPTAAGVVVLGGGSLGDRVGREGGAGAGP